MTFKKLITHTSTLGIVLASSLSFAQNRQQHLDPIPEAPRPTTPDGQGVTQQAGVGGDVAFARAGVLELGGSAAYSASGDLSQLTIAPSIGYFVMDNWQVTGSVQWRHAKVTGAGASDIFVLLAEPSFHLPFTDTNFGFVGVGLGLAKTTGADLGMAVAPRIGYKVLVGRSGMLTTDIRDTIFTNEVKTTGNVTSFTLANTVAVGIGYTVLW
ncbi:MAG: hypothetical protein ABIR96_12100 [Bdellovibrionota bacterium]